MPEQKLTYQQRVDKEAHGVCSTLFQDSSYGECDYQEFAVPIGKIIIALQAEAIILYAYGGNMQMYKDDTNGKKHIDTYLFEHGYIEPKTGNNGE